MKFDQPYPVTQIDAAKLQIAILEVLASKAIIKVNGDPESQLGTDIQEITKRINLKEVIEVQRYLYILEGQQMVSPVPQGDLTSHVWSITPLGYSTLERLRHVLLAA
jgi:hypothetical protein